MNGTDIPKKRERTAHRLSAVKVSKIKEPGLYEDGAGLRLVVTDMGTKRWVLRVTINGKRVERGLGVYPDIRLSDAREQSAQIRRLAKFGRDARAEEKQKRLAGATFAEAFETFFAVREQQLKNGKHVQQWRNTMRDYVFPKLGQRSVADISAAEVLDVLRPIWFTKPETARRVLQRLKLVFDSSILRGVRERANPCIGVSAELGTDHRKVEHHAAMPWREVPKFVSGLKDRSAMPVTKLLFEFLILTASRSGEARGALWSEFDFEKNLWTIPGFDPATGRRLVRSMKSLCPSEPSRSCKRLASFMIGRLCSPVRKAKRLVTTHCQNSCVMPPYLPRRMVLEVPSRIGVLKTGCATRSVKRP